MNSNFSEREQVVEAINRLFFYTDYQAWEKLINEVFTSEVLVDMVSVGAKDPEIMTSQEICENWKESFKDLDAIHHQSGNHIVEINGKEAHVKSYAIASHFKKEASNGPIREFVGSYDFELLKLVKGWRITKFKFNLKYLVGNVDLN